MSVEDTIRALLREAIPVLRAGLRDTTTEALVEDFSGAWKRMLRRAYEVGYREGVASTGVADTTSLDGGDDAQDESGDASPRPVAFDEASEDDLEPEEHQDAPLQAPDTDDVESDAESSPTEPGSPEPRPVDWGDQDVGEHTPRRREPSSLRIFPHATVGTLLHRIHDYFGLDRFDIDVVVCRKGDRARRQLKKSVRLAKYEVLE